MSVPGPRIPCPHVRLGAINVREKGKRLGEARKLLEVKGLRDLFPNIILYRTAISVCDMAKQPYKAKKCLVVTLLIGLGPNVITYRAAFGARDDAQQPDWSR